MCCMEFCLNDQGNLFKCVVWSSIYMNMGTYLKCVVWSSVSMIMGTYLNVLYGVLSQ